MAERDGSKIHIVSERERNPEDLLNPREVAAMLNVNLSWVKNHTTRTEPFLPFVKLGAGRNTMRRFRRADVLQFIEDNLQRPRRTA